MYRCAVLTAFLGSVVSVGCTPTQGQPTAEKSAPVSTRAASTPPPAPREFRAAWVATVDNIDWPSKKGLPADQQKAEVIAILDKAAELKLNCLVVQIRTTADALYASKLEPWSVYLTGTQGKDPGYDPLKLWIDEGHRRGIEIHAWFNPYRARFSDSKQPLAANHIASRRPDLVVSYGKYLWLNPGEPDAAKHSLAVFNDVVKRYDVDGIHIDDYFYPYPILDDAKKEVPFPDDAAWAKYKKKHPVKPNPTTAPADVDRVAREDWRRESVNELIHDIHTSTRRIKPWVKFGISPFGIGRKGLVPGISGFDQYDKLYADAAMWLREGWCDYFTPQLYWPIEQKAQSFPVLLNYWQTENKKNIHIWPGLFTSKLIDNRSTLGNEAAATKPASSPASVPASKPSTQPNYWNADQFVRQIQTTRDMKADGHVHFSMKALQRDSGGVSSALSEQLYQADALIPASPWLDNKAPPKPSATVATKDGATILTLKPGRGEATWLYAVWKLTPDGWQFQKVPGSWKAVQIESNVSDVVISAVDRCGNESDRVTAAR